MQAAAAQTKSILPPVAKDLSWWKICCDKLECEKSYAFSIFETDPPFERNLFLYYWNIFW